MLVLVVIRALEALALLQAVAGVTLGVLYARDNNIDLRRYRAQGWNGFAELAAMQGVRSGQSKAGLHAMLAVLPAISLIVAPAARREALAAIVFWGALNLGQVAVIRAQALNWRDRIRLRRRLAEAADPAHP